MIWLITVITVDNWICRIFVCDNAQLFRHITCNNDGDLLQKDLLDIQVWMDNWLLKLNIKKCKVVSYGDQIDFEIK